MELQKHIIKKSRKLGFQLVGFAPVERWSNPPQPLKLDPWIPEEFWPQSIYPEAKTVIVLGIPVQLPVLETAPSNYYNVLYHTVNNLLDEGAYKLSQHLTELGHPSIFTPRDGYGSIEVLLENPVAMFSHKHAAYLTGMGSFGYNNVILTKEYGPRVRLTSIFTTAEIETETPQPLNLCTRCMLCAKHCPAGVMPAESKVFPAVIDKLACARRSAMLREAYCAPCGICIKVCPVGEDRKTYRREKTSIYTNREQYPQYHRAWEHCQRYGGKTTP
jgi:epoxyqueuosine reductase QueG